MPALSACAQILWNNLWITRSWLALPYIRHRLRRVARFLTNTRRAKSEPDQALCPQVVLDRESKDGDVPPSIPLPARIFSFPDSMARKLLYPQA
jgi:hypothetical protein